MDVHESPVSETSVAPGTPPKIAPLPVKVPTEKPEVVKTIGDINAKIISLNEVANPQQRIAALTDAVTQLYTMIKPGDKEIKNAIIHLETAISHEKEALVKFCDGIITQGINLIELMEMDQYVEKRIEESGHNLDAIKQFFPALEEPLKTLFKTTLNVKKNIETSEVKISVVEIYTLKREIASLNAQLSKIINYKESIFSEAGIPILNREKLKPIHEFFKQQETYLTSISAVSNSPIKDLNQVISRLQSDKISAADRDQVNARTEDLMNNLDTLEKSLSASPCDISMVGVALFYVKGALNSLTDNLHDEETKSFLKNEIVSPASRLVEKLSQNIL